MSQDIQQERDRFSALYENFPEPTITYEFTDGEPIIRAVNDAFVDVFGFDRDTAVGTSIDELIVPPDRSAEAQEIDDRVRAGEQVDVELRRQTSDGVGDFRFRNISAPETVAVDGFGVYADISARKEREDELRNLKEEYRTVFETAQDAIFLWDIEVTGSDYEFRLQRLNPAHESISGLSTEEDRGKTPRELLGEQTGAEVAAKYERCAEAKEPVTYEEELEMPSGTIQWHTKLGPVIRDGQVTQIVGISRDITARKKREEELERYETIVETVGDPVYTLDNEGHFTYVNQALVEITGYQEEALLGEHASKVMSPEDVERGEALIEELLSSNQNQGTFEMGLITARGQRIPCENHIGLLTFDEEFQGTVGILRDISDRLEHERELERQNERLEEFASVVSHDLRNPMNVAAGRVKLAAEECDSDHLDTASRALSRMETITDDMLSLARAGVSVGETEAVELPALVDACWHNVNTESAQLVTDTDIVIRADETRLQQLIENLVRNAVKYGGPDATITVGDLPDGFYIEDDGPGIPEDERGSVFEPGYTSTDSGSGFGLSIVREIAQAHGWELSVNESDDGGARFVFRGVETE